MKILIASDWYMPSINGVVTSITLLIKELVSLGHDVRVLTLSSNSSWSFVDNIYYVPSISARIIYPGARISFKMPKQIMRSIISWQPEIVHSQLDFSTNFMARKIADITNSVLIYTCHTMYQDYTQYLHLGKTIGAYLLRKGLKLFSSKADIIIAPSDKVKKKLLEYGIGSKLVVIPTGIRLNKSNNNNLKPLKHLLKIPENNFVIIYIGRLAKEKNIKEILDYFNRMASKRISLVIVGGGPLEKHLIQYSKSLAMCENIIFTGMVEHSRIQEYYSMADIFISASTSEAQGLTIFEALASGLPVLCRNDEAIGEIIVDSINGYKYNDFNNFCRFILNALNDKNEYSKMRSQALTTANLYSVDEYVGKIECLYINLRKIKSQEHGYGDIWY